MYTEESHSAQSPSGKISFIFLISLFAYKFCLFFSFSTKTKQIKTSFFSLLKPQNNSKAMTWLRQSFKYTSKTDFSLARNHRHKTQIHTPVKVTAALLNSSSAVTTSYHRLPLMISFIFRIS